MFKPLTCLVLAGAFLLPFIAAAQETIYDKANWVDPTTEPTCPVVHQDLIDLMNAHVAAQETSSLKTYVVEQEITTVNSGDRCTVYLNYRYCKENRTNPDFKNCSNNGMQTASGPIEYSYMCVDHPYTVTHYPEGKEQPQCYAEDDLADVDTCPDNVSASDYVLPAGSGASDSICSAPSSDLSSCHYNLDTSGDFYVASFENTQCYSGATTAQPLTPDSPPDGYCQQSGDALMCNESPSNVCDTEGNCQSGCGSYSYDGVEAFVCFANDTDSDGVPDYSDTDIDGDGTPNSEDEDWDGDGINDPDYDSGRSGSGGTDSGTGAGTGSGSGTNGPTAEQIKDALTEPFDSDGLINDFSNSLNNMKSEQNAAIDSAVEGTDFTSPVQDSNFESGWRTAIPVFNQTPCTDISHTFGSYTISIPICEAAEKARPYIYIVLAVITFIYSMVRIANTIRGGTA